MGIIKTIRIEITQLIKGKSWGAADGANEQLMYQINKKVSAMPVKNQELHHKGQCRKFLREMSQFAQ